MRTTISWLSFCTPSLLLRQEKSSQLVKCKICESSCVIPHIVGLCPDGSSPVNCLVNPCVTASCPAVGDATCVADYCGGCNARWILNGQEVTDQCHGI